MRSLMEKDQLPERLRNMKGMQMVTEEPPTLTLTKEKLLSLAPIYLPLLEKKSREELNP